jgi:hypothetical protein
MTLLTDKAFATVLNLSDIIHLVDVSDLSGSPFGTSKKITLTQLKTIVDSDTQNLSNVLGFGNATSDGQKIVSQNGNVAIDLRAFGANDSFLISNDPAGKIGASDFSMAWLNMAQTFSSIGMGNVMLSMSTTIGQLTTNWQNNSNLSRLSFLPESLFFQVVDDGTGKTGEMGIRNNVSGSYSTTNVENLSGHFSAQNATINSSIYNSVAVGGNSTIVKTAQTAYGNQFGFNAGEAFETILNYTTPTQDNTATIQNDSGVLAFLTDSDLGNSLIVSSKGVTIANGAVRESVSRHFSSLIEAVSVALSGDTIYIYGGTHGTGATNLYKDGVIYDCKGNPTINATAGTMFNDNGVAGEFVMRGNAFLNNPSGGVFNFTGVQTKVDIECQNVSSLTVCFQFEDTVGCVRVHDKVFSTAGACLYMDNASDIIFNAKFMENTKNNGITINTRGTFVGNCVVNAHNIKGTPTLANSQILLFAQVGNTGKTTINVTDKIQLAGTALTSQTILTGNGEIIINGDVDGGAGNAFGIEQTPELITHNGNAYNDGTHPVVSITGGDVCDIFLNGKYTSSNADVIVQNNVNSTLTIDGEIYNTNALAVAKSGVLVSGNSATLFKNVKIIMDIALGTPVSVGASVAKNIKVIHSLGSNASADANITNLIAGAIFNTDLDYQ